MARFRVQKVLQEIACITKVGNDKHNFGLIVLGFSTPFIWVAKVSIDCIVWLYSQNNLKSRIDEVRKIEEPYVHDLQFQSEAVWGNWESALPENLDYDAPTHHIFDLRLAGQSSTRRFPVDGKGMLSFKGFRLGFN